MEHQPPESVRAASIILMIIGGLQIVLGAALLVAILRWPDVLDFPEFGDRATLARWTALGAVIVLPTNGAAYIFLASKLNRGRRWARTTILVLLGLAALSNIVQFGLAVFTTLLPTTERPVEPSGVCCGIALVIVVIALLCTASAKAFFVPPDDEPLPSQE